MRRVPSYVTLLMSSSIAVAAALAPASSLGQNAASVSASVELAIPDTAAGRRFSAWLQAFNAGDAAALAAFGQSFVPGAAAPPPGGLLGFRSRTGGFDLRKIVDAEERRLIVVMEGRSDGQFARLTLELDAEGRILAMPIQPVPRPPEFALPRLDDRALVAQLGTELDRLTRADAFSGAVLVLKDGKPIFNEAYGMADRTREIPNRTDSGFRLASMGKIFTGTAVVQLIQAGKVRLSDPIGKFLPDYPNAEVAKVTIEQLLTHTGGTGDIFTPEFMARADQVETLQDYVDLFGTRAPLSAPGSRYAYSNYGYVLLGRVIEAASGESYYDYLQHHIFDPLGMTSTGFWRESEPLAGRVIGYDQNAGYGATRGAQTDRASPAGGAVSSLGDLAKFAQGLLDHKLLDAAHTELLTTGRVDMGPNRKYALGFGDVERGTRLHSYGHNGGAPGQNSDLKIYPEAGYVTIVLSNFGPPAAGGVAEFIADRIGG